ncbi:MAG TPA: CHRD domain-containing protein [Actinotalea sp.]|nr:CHRD domain-containing protein [Actinotalea sp.]
MSASRRIPVGLALMAVVALGVAPGASAGGRPFTTELTGEAEVTAAGVPNQGDPDGVGTAELTINPGLGEVCWSIEVSGVAPILAAHIHVAPSTLPGPVVVPLNPYTGGCTTVDPEVTRAIVKDPSAYYVNVHNADYPAGALRGQLDR